MSYGTAVRLPALPPGMLVQAVRFGAVGVASTLAYMLLFLLLREPLGAQGANLTALLLTAIGNTLLNRRFTFGVTGAHRRTRHLAQGLAVFAVALALTSGSLAALHAAGSPRRVLELTVLTVANVVATCLRFALLRWWVFRHRPAATPVDGTTSQQDARTS